MSFSESFSFLHEGGWVAWVLTGLCAVLWYAMGYRFFYLQTKALRGRPEHLQKINFVDADPLSRALVNVQDILAGATGDLETALYFEWQQLAQKLTIHRATVRAIVIVAPLLGLLGTVIGMIETFDSLKDAALFSQGGGIAGGISQALITTQLGLVVAIPGLLIGRKLDEQEKSINQFMEQVVHHVLSQPQKEVIHEV